MLGIIGAVMCDVHCTRLGRLHVSINIELFFLPHGIEDGGTRLWDSDQGQIQSTAGRFWIFALASSSP